MVLTISCRGQSQVSLRDLQLADPDVGPILRGKDSGQKPSLSESLANGPSYWRLHQIWRQLIVKDGILWRVFESYNGNTSHLQLVTPIALREEVTMSMEVPCPWAILVKTRRWLNSRRGAIGLGTTTMCRSGVRLARSALPGSLSHPKRKAPLQPVTVGYPMQSVAVDILGPLPELPIKETHTCW